MAESEPVTMNHGSTMKALLCEHHGPAEELTIRDLPDPEPGPGEVVVTVKAAALNFFDTLIIQGRYQTRPAFPFSPSAECAGPISALGEGLEDRARESLQPVRDGGADLGRREPCRC